MSKETQISFLFAKTSTFHNFHFLMDSLTEKLKSNLELLDSSKLNLRRRLDSLQSSCNSVVLLTVQWEEMESYIDSMKDLLQKRAEELEAWEESMKKKEKELSLKLSDLEKEKELYNKSPGKSSCSCLFMLRVLGMLINMISLSCTYVTLQVYVSCGFRVVSLNAL